MAIAFNAAADLGNNTGTSWTVSYTSGSGLNRLLVLGVIGDGHAQTGHDDITSVTYGGFNMVLAAKEVSNASASDGRYTYFYYLLNPPSGANNVIIQNTNSHYVGALAADYTGVAQLGQPDKTNNNITATNGNKGPATISLTTIEDNCWAIVVGAAYDAGVAPTSGTNTTRRSYGVANGEPFLGDSNGVITPPGSITLNWTYNSGSNNFAANATNVIASFAPAAPCSGQLPVLGVGCSLAGAVAYEGIRRLKRNRVQSRREFLRGWVG